MDPDSLVEDWIRRARESQFGHYEAAKYYKAQHLRIGIPVVILTAVVGTSIFASLQYEESLLIKLIAGGFSIGASALAALQTFLRSSERAEKHRAAGAAYGAIRRELDLKVSLGLPGPSDLEGMLNRFRTRFDELAKQSPEISPGIWSKSETMIDSSNAKEHH